MSNPGDADHTPLTSTRQMAEYLATGCKPAAEFRIGTEHEKFGFRHADLAPPPYLAADGQPGNIRDLLVGLAFGLLRYQDGAYVDVSADTLHAEKDCEQNARSE